MTVKMASTATCCATGMPVAAIVVPPAMISGRFLGLNASRKAPRPKVLAGASVSKAVIHRGVVSGAPAWGRPCHRRITTRNNTRAKPSLSQPTQTAGSPRAAARAASVRAKVRAAQGKHAHERTGGEQYAVAAATGGGEEQDDGNDRKRAEGYRGRQCQDIAESLSHGAPSSPEVMTKIPPIPPCKSSLFQAFIGTCRQILLVFLDVLARP